MTAEVCCRSHHGMVLAPGLAIFITVMIFNLLGDTLRDYMDPRQSEQHVERMIEMERRLTAVLRCASYGGGQCLPAAAASGDEKAEEEKQGTTAQAGEKIFVLWHHRLRRRDGRCRS